MPLPPDDVLDDGRGSASVEMDLWRLVVWLWDNRLLLVTGTCAGIGLAVAVSLMLPKTYEALATVFITPPTYATELKPAPLSVEAYARLAESDFIRARVEAVLRKDGVLDVNEQIGRLVASLYPSREPQKPYLPLIGLTATSTNPAVALKIANTWAAVFVEEQMKLAELGKSGSVDFILSEHPKAAARLLEEERRLNEMQERQSRMITDATTRAAIDLKQAQLQSREQSIVTFESELYKARIELTEARQRLRQAEEELARTPPVINLAKAITDDALWDRVAGAPPERQAALDALSTSRLQSQEVNPVHTQLAQSVANQRITVTALAAREEVLTRQIEAARKDAAALRADLEASRLAVDTLQRQLEVESAPLLRAVDEAESLVEELDSKLGQAIIAQSERGSDVKVGALAELPRQPVGPSLAQTAAIAGLASLGLSLLAAWVLAHTRQERAPQARTEKIDRAVAAL